MNAGNDSDIQLNGKDSRGFHFRLSEDSLSVLKTLIGKPIRDVVASRIQAAGQHFTAPTFSITQSSKEESRWVHRYVVFSCKWFETPLFLIDAWQLLVSLQDKPGDVLVNTEGTLLALHDQLLER